MTWFFEVFCLSEIQCSGDIMVSVAPQTLVGCKLLVAGMGCSVMPTGDGRALSPPDVAELLESVAVWSLPEFLQAVVAQAVGTDGAALSCGLTVQVSEYAALTFSSSDAVADRLDQAQYEHRDGPCVQALNTGHLVAVDDLASDTRWPWFSEQAQASGLQGSLSVPLSTRHATVGALNLYQRAGEAFTNEDRQRALAFADQAAPVVALAARLAARGTSPPSHSAHLHTRAPYEDRTAVPEADEVEQLRDLAFHDDLTGLANRRGISSLLEEFLDDGIRDRVGVLFCDLDSFKRINDGLGHEAGDTLLVTLARRLHDGLPSGCTPARISGDEFVVICSDVEALGGLEALISRVSKLFSGPVPAGQSVVEMTASVGAAMVTGPGITGADLLRFADAAMFEAKHRGPGSVSVSNPSLVTAVDRQLALEADLRHALDHGDLMVHYQPVVDRSGTILMVEALMRWPHPQHGMIPPPVILEAAREGNLLVRLDEYILRSAINEARTWGSLLQKPPAVAVNLGALNESSHLADNVIGAVEDAGLNWTQLVLEVAETPLAGLSDTNLQAMIDLEARGLRFAIDDFGTGYSSLARLGQLPIQIIKLDKGFTAHLDDLTARAVSAAVASIAASIGNMALAEGVETSAQLSTVEQLGYHAYQGWLISPAVPPHELRTLLTHGPLPMPPPPNT